MMSLFHCPADIHHGEQGEHEGLEESGKDHEYEHGNGHQEGDKDKENDEDQVFTKNIAKEPHGQGKRSCKMTNELDRQHDGRHPPHRAEKLLDILYAMDLDPDDVREEKYGKRHGEIRVEIRRWGIEAGDNASQITHQDEEEECRHQWEEDHSLFAHRIDEQALQSADHNLQKVLKPPRNQLDASSY